MVIIRIIELLPVLGAEVAQRRVSAPPSNEAEGLRVLRRDKCRRSDRAADGP